MAQATNICYILVTARFFASSSHKLTSKQRARSVTEQPSLCEGIGAQESGLTLCVMYRFDKEPNGTGRQQPILQIVALIAVIITSAAFLYPQLQALGTGRSEHAEIELATTTVTVTSVAPGTTKLRVLGTGEEIKATKSDAATNTAGTPSTQIHVPAGSTSVVAALSKRDSIVGLVIVSSGDTLDSSYHIDSASTAHTLIVLSPQVLTSNINNSLGRAEQYMQTQEFQELVTAIDSNGLDLSVDQPEVSKALANLLTKEIVVPTHEPVCSSDYSSMTAGVCVNQTSQTRLANMVERSVLVFSGTDSSVCAVLGPYGSSDSTVTLSSEACSEQLLITSPGTFENRSVQQLSFLEEISSATLVDIYREYVSPFVDLAGSAAGHNAKVATVLESSRIEIVDLMVKLSSQGQPLYEPSHIGLVIHTPAKRVWATTISARVLIDASVSNPFIMGRHSGDQHYVAILDLYLRSANQIADDTESWYGDYEVIELIQPQTQGGDS